MSIILYQPIRDQYWLFNQSELSIVLYQPIRDQYLPALRSDLQYQSDLNLGHWPSPPQSPWPCWWRGSWRSYQQLHRDHCYHQPELWSQSLSQYLAWSWDRKSLIVNIEILILRYWYWGKYFNMTRYLGSYISYIVTSQPVETMTIVTSLVSLHQHRDVFRCMLPTVNRN